MFHNYLFKSLVTNYINKTRINSVIFGLLPDVCETCKFFGQLSRKVPSSVFCGANHEKRLIFLFWLKSVLLCYNLWNKKPKCNIWRPHWKSIPYPQPQGLAKILDREESQDSRIYSVTISNVFTVLNLNIIRYTNADLKICQYLRLHMKITCQRFQDQTLFTFWNRHTWDMYKVFLRTFRNNRIWFKLHYFLWNLQNLRANNSRILRLRMRNFQCIDFTGTQTYRKIFKSALVYL